VVDQKKLYQPSSVPRPTMAAASSSTVSIPVTFTTTTAYPLPPQKYFIPSTWKRFQLSQLINKALSLDQPIPFDFIVKNDGGKGWLRGTVGEVSQGGVRNLSWLRLYTNN
jgi:hypothetical protein